MDVEPLTLVSISTPQDPIRSKQIIRRVTLYRCVLSRASSDVLGSGSIVTLNGGYTLEMKLR